MIINNKATQLLLLLPLFLVSSWVSAQNKLPEYQHLAAENSPELKAVFAEYLAALQQAPQAGALPDPVLAFAYFIQPVETRVGPQQFKVAASQLFPWFGTRKAKENVALLNAKVKYELLLETKSRLAHSIRTAYYALYLNRRSIAITAQNILLLESLKQLIIARIESGQASVVDDYRLQLELNDLQSQLEQLKDQQGVLSLQLNNLINAPEQIQINTPNRLSTPVFHLSKAQALDSLRTNNHKLLSLAQQDSTLLARQTLVRKLGMPSFSVGIDYTFVGTGEQNNLAGTDAIIFPKIGISIPLYRKKYKAMVNEVEQLQVAKAQEQVHTENSLETAFETTWANYTDAQRRIELYTRQHSLAEQASKLLDTEYATGKTSFEELLRIERKLLQYTLSLEKARADHQSATSTLQYLIGNN